MWVADMDFMVAEPIRKALIERARHGYLATDKERRLPEAAVNWQRKETIG